MAWVEEEEEPVAVAVVEEVDEEEEEEVEEDVVVLVENGFGFIFIQAFDLTLGIGSTPSSSE
tara:strand:- start:27 stop:212 length:186 start_codon:yes stop_codon:yes gene_type:complete